MTKLFLKLFSASCFVKPKTARLQKQLDCKCLYPKGFKLFSRESGQNTRKTARFERVVSTFLGNKAVSELFRAVSTSCFVCPPPYRGHAGKHLSAVRVASRERLYEICA